MTQVLLLNADYTPLDVLAWQKAVCLLLEDKVGVVSEYAGRAIRSAHLTLPWPAVVALRRYSRHRSRVPFNRMHVIARDGATCQYCGSKPRGRTGRLKLEELTLDHVVPRAQSRRGRVVLPWSGKHVPVTCWENVVTACAACNRSKGAMTPDEAGMSLLGFPRVPTSREAVALTFARARVPEEWREFLPDDAGSLRL